MIKFFKVKDTEIRKVAEVINDEVVEIKAIIGQVGEMLAKEIIFPDNTTGNEEKWIVIDSQNIDNIVEFYSLTEAKTFCKGRWAE